MFLSVQHGNLFSCENAIEIKRKKGRRMNYAKAVLHSEQIQLLPVHGRKGKPQFSVFRKLSAKKS